ncbi:DUF3077 domain-containing protein [Pseudomonas lactis]|uniref:DUF3077 domain-containing protein n=1 Tax=Pseudomonas lactis TaxID=1615674 RepID=UPI001472FF5C|nr:DUF3077 domain-containing protein [Pseudomonas lactis]NNA53223.1 DUF3077 domain-containing protein [Pseudomonas lactis]
MKAQTYKRSKTESVPFRQCGMVDGKAFHAFQVPAGVDASDALEEVSTIISTTFDMITDAGFGNLKIEGNYAWMLLNSLESAKALLDAVLLGMIDEEEILAALARCQGRDTNLEGNVGAECGTQRAA